MSTIVLINPFEVPDGEEEQFLAGWRAAADHLRQQQGFVSTRMHQSLDPATRFRFVNVAEWASADHYRRAVSSPQFQTLARRLNATAHPALYQVIQVIAADT
jgi:heme oxygenase (mycobilin-producing)